MTATPLIELQNINLDDYFSFAIQPTTKLEPLGGERMAGRRKALRLIEQAGARMSPGRVVLMSMVSAGKSRNRRTETVTRI